MRRKATLMAAVLLATACSPQAVEHAASHVDDATTHDVARYNPCPAADAACAIMPLGDSITFGRRSASGGGYRDYLFHLAHRDHKQLTFVGALQNGPAAVDGVAFPRNHEGYPGYTIRDDTNVSAGIAPLVAAEMIAYKPHIVLLMIGANDMTLQLDLANAPKRLGDLMDTILSTDPRVLLIVAQVVPTRTERANMLVRAYNAAIPALVRARAAAGKHVLLVDMYGAFVSDPNYKAALLADAVHPNDAGYAVMAGVWYAALEPLLH